MPPDQLNPLALARAIPDLRLRYRTLRRQYTVALAGRDDAKVVYEAAGSDEERAQWGQVARRYAGECREIDAALLEVEALLSDGLDEELKAEARREAEQDYAVVERWRAERDRRSLAALVSELKRMPAPKRIVSTVTGALNGRLRPHWRGGRRESRSRSRAAAASRASPSSEPPSPERLAADEALLRAALAEFTAVRLALGELERRPYVVELSLAALLERGGR